MPQFVDLKGCRFGRLLVLERAENASDNATRFLCQCDCGNRKIIRAKHLKSGAIQDCGCGKSKRMAARNLKHGGSGTRLYNIWIKMRDRCHNPNSADWHDYGGRGISVCATWDLSFDTFREWAMKNGYDESKSIDRIDVNAGYFPDNCRWASASVQANNKRNNHYIIYHGEQITLADAAKNSPVPYGTIKRRIAYYGWNADDAVDTPIGGKRPQAKKENTT